MYSVEESAKSGSFTSAFPIYIFIIIFFLIAMVRTLKLQWIWLVRVDIAVLFLILDEMLSGCSYFYFFFTVENKEVILNRLFSNGLT